MCTTGALYNYITLCVWACVMYVNLHVCAHVHVCEVHSYENSWLR